MLYDYIIKSIPKNLNKFEIARFIYIKLTSLVSFSTTINNTDTDSFYTLLNLKIDPKKFNDTEINCYIWSQLYSALLNHFDIKNEIVKYWHSYVIFYIDDTKYVADATFGRYSDISRIHYKDKTTLFGPCLYQDKSIKSNITILNEEFIILLNNIDKKINYSTEKTILFKQLLNNIRSNKISNISNNSITSKLEFIFAYVGNLSFGYYESKEFIYELENNIFNRDELDKIKTIELKRINDSDKIEIMQCIYAKDNEEYKYYILYPNTPIKSVTKESILSLSSKGFCLSKKKSGIIIPEIK